VFDVGQHQGRPYLVTELLEGETLRRRLEAGALPVRKAIELAIAIASGLGAAHEQGIVHRDLKPENLFITGDGRVKILDFGLAKLVRPGDSDPPLASAPTIEAETGPGVVMGTAGYMSPEQVRGQRVDHRSDIFGFGAILYEMLSGRRAFRGDTPADTMSAILREDPPDLTIVDETIPLVLQRVVRHCLDGVGPSLRRGGPDAGQPRATSRRSTAASTWAGVITFMHGPSWLHHIPSNVVNM
jgi:serine/threonine protein kinase